MDNTGAANSTDESEGVDATSTTTTTEFVNATGDAVFGTAGLRGFIKKRGMIPPVYFTSYAAPARQMAFDRWITAYVHGIVFL